MPDALIWPAVAVICILILGTITLFLLRPALLHLVDRTKKVGKDGLTFERPQEGGKPETALLLNSLNSEKILGTPYLIFDFVSHNS
jgi:hypothetical protein